MLLDRAKLTWKLFWDERVSPLTKAIPILGLAYVLSPLDLLPELALGPVGALDDVGIIMLVLSLFIQAAPPDIVQEYLRQFSEGRGQQPALEGDEDIIDGEIIDQ